MTSAYAYQREQVLQTTLLGHIAKDYAAKDKDPLAQAFSAKATGWDIAGAAVALSGMAIIASQPLEKG